ncbi:hypothetical protein AAF712_012104 [Marasmius tenuissimus]|uniref:Aminoglycoside phosphotransferase domain-containing protein n=1 Tax=Marasmius tenuissimus TaxID=585030 RepID=A0ABR2ZHH9_9AGAR
MPVEITLEQARKVAAKTFQDTDHSYAIRIVELTSDTFRYGLPEYPSRIFTQSCSYTRTNRAFVVDLARSEDSPPTHSTFLITSAAPRLVPESNATDTVYHTNNLQVYTKLITLVRKTTSLPFNQPVLDSSLTDIPCPYLLTPAHPITSSSMTSLSSARKQNLISSQHNVLIDLTLGQMLGQLHSGVQNEWFGLPVAVGDPLDPSYSWQETFSVLIETLMHEVESKEEFESLELPFDDLRRCLSRAIAFYLFDDVEAPSLVWFTGSEDDIYIALPPPGSSDPPNIVAILPNLAHALWGDPHLESFFLPPAPTRALKEGYEAGGGEPLELFARQKTKRSWYTVFLALVVLRERGDGVGAELGGKTRGWAIETLAKEVEFLKDAPCY